MANERRVARVSKQLEREIGTLLQGDPVVQTAICPERGVGFDSAISALASVTEVRLSSDLQVAKIYLSVYSDEKGKASALQGLTKLQGYVRTKLAGQMRLRAMPEIRFFNDDAAEQGEQVLMLLEKIKRQDAGEEDLPPIVMRPLRGDPEQKVVKRSRKSKEEDPAEDGFLDLEEGDANEEFLAEMSNATEEEDDDTGEEINSSDADDDDDEDEDSEDEDSDDDVDMTADVINNYLAGRHGEDYEYVDPSFEDDTPKPEQNKQRKSRRRR